MFTIMNPPNPHKTTDDSGFHIVQKNGQFEIVKLEPVDRKTKTKFSCDNNKKQSNCHTEHCKSSECHLRSNHQISSKYDSSQPQSTTTRFGKYNLESKYPSLKCGFNKPTDFEETSNAAVPLKTYSRAGKKDTKPTLIRLTKSESPATQTTTTLFVPVNIKIEPELDIVDEEPEQMEKNIKKDKINQNVTSPTSILADEEDADTATIKARPDTFYNSNVAAIPSLHLLQELATKATKCNVCGMIFPKYQNQVITLGRHFLRHKTSVINVVKEYNRDTHSKQKRMVQTPGPNKSPVILNKLLKNAPKPMAVIPLPVMKTQSEGPEKVEITKPRIDTTKLPTILKKRKLIEIKALPHDLLQRLRSCHSAQKGGQSHVIIGNTLIKPIIKATSTTKAADEERSPANTFITEESKRSDDMVSSDEDDDIEIVEQKPELIVIDDNDELEARLEESK